MEIDHIFICVNDDGRGADALKALGLAEGTPLPIEGSSSETLSLSFYISPMS